MGKREGGREGGRCLKCALNPLPLYPRRPFILRAACVRALSELSAAGEGPSRNRNPPRYFPSSSSPPWRE